MTRKTVQLEVYDQTTGDYIPAYPATTKDAVEGLAEEIRRLEGISHVPEDLAVKLSEIDGKARVEWVEDARQNATDIPAGLPKDGVIYISRHGIGVKRGDSVPIVSPSFAVMAAANGKISQNFEQFAVDVETTINQKVDKITGKGLSTNDYDNAAKAKVDKIPENPKYTDTTYNSATTSVAGLMSAADKAKSDRWEGVTAISSKNLNEIYAAGMYSAQNCTNAPTGGAYGAMLVMRTDATVSGTGTDTVQLYLTKDDKVYVRNCTDKSGGAWTGWREIGAGQTYTNATASAAGLMSAADKAKLDGLSNSGSASIPDGCITDATKKIKAIRVLGASESTSGIPDGTLILRLP